ncbi:thioesterase [Burkholderia stagnalis]
MRSNAERATSVTVRNRPARWAAVARMMAIGLGVGFAMSDAAAAGQAAAGGIVRFTGALVDRYDVTFDAPSGAIVEGREAAGSGVATLRFDAHGRRLPGAHVAWIGLGGTSDADAGVRATWRDARDDRSVPLVSGRAYRIGPYGGVMTVAADEATGAAAPVVISIRHP